MNDKKELGKITKVFFGKEDHDILSFMIHFDFGGSGQGFGGYCLDTFDKDKKKRVGCAAGTDLILRLLDLFNVKTLDEIIGKNAYVIRGGESTGWNSPIIGIETPPFEGGKRFMIEDWKQDWFPNTEEKSNVV